VADDKGTSEGQGQGEGEGQRPIEQRVDSIEEEQRRQGGLLERILASVSGTAPAAPAAAQEATAARLGGPVDVREEARQEVARALADQEREKEHHSLKETVARLSEVTPEPPQRKIERVMWGARKIERVMW
jgi:hypothetical protein